VYLRRRARRRLPRFAFEYLDGGAGADGGIQRNRSALDARVLTPRYGVVTVPPPTATTLFGRSYSAPFGVAPMGGPSIAWPGADRFLAAAAQQANVPYVLGTFSGITIECASATAPDVWWFQLYRAPNNDHAIALDLIDRARVCGAHALVMTIDVPVRTTRPREVAAGLSVPFRPTLRMIGDLLVSPAYTNKLLSRGQPRFANLYRYAGESVGVNDIDRFASNELVGTFTWEEVARFRDRWQGPLLVKGLLHPDDAERAVSIGADGIWVSNHGGRQVEALPATIDVLGGIVDAVAGRATVLVDSGVSSGQDISRVLREGADAAFVGKAFLWALGALGDEGPAYLCALLANQLSETLGQLGASTPAAIALANPKPDEAAATPGVPL
tara:strand:- start:1597 stop:2751 length:1155 start_codon:yes stop_codon:yes gene_type:complete